MHVLVEGECSETTEEEKNQSMDWNIKTLTPLSLSGKVKILIDDEYRPPSTWACQVIYFHYTCKQKVNYVTEFSFLLLKGERMRLTPGTYDSLSTLVTILDMNLE